ncbi:alpha/beta fold hydrolase [Nocardia cyriacigeorgica]|uniref:alpha/beta fold hydrolase n=1 Tax=Nocardia cyriacigeorgica TaxID=135487 RepID=UPI0013D72283|nr:alpha/beta hydrolase [Nocardia cyriacigeorgica]NEW27707.1 alpha/beta hydrolase [Nocardia cyriacigeorgica]
MRSAYLNAPSRELIRLWCNTQLQDSAISHRQWSITTSAGLTSVVELGHAREPEPVIVVVPGTNMNTAASLPFLAELASRRRIIALDIPGQPGLSASQRPSRDRMTWYGRWLDETLEQTVPNRAVLLGHSLGGAIALACSSQRIAGRVLVAPAGLVRLAVPPRLLTATLRWLAAPSYTSTGRLLQLMTSPTRGATPDLVEWMTLVARYCRTTLAPAPLSPQLLAGCRSVPTLVATGSRDIFLPPQRLRPAVSAHLGTELRVIADCGHLALDDHPTRVADLVDELAASI